VKTVIATIVLLTLVGCSSSPKKVAGQFCHTSQTVEVADGERVSSKTTVQCSDDPVDRIVIKKAGIAQNCGEFKYWTTLKGRPVERRSISCQKLDGTWEIMPAVMP
jgi:hypothetical protein